MSIIDICIILLAVWALVTGWRHGFIRQLCSLAAIVLGIIAASRFGYPLGKAFGCDDTTAAAAGFVVIFFVSLLAVGILARLLRRITHLAGLGSWDIVLGILLGEAKLLVILGVLFSSFNAINRNYTIVKKSTLDRSVLYAPVSKVPEAVFPFLEWIGDRIPDFPDGETREA